MVIGQFVVTSSNSSKTQVSSVRVKRGGMTLVLLRFGSRSNPFNFLKNNPQSAERREFVNSLTEAGVSVQDIRSILEYQK